MRYPRFVFIISVVGIMGFMIGVVTKEFDIKMSEVQFNPSIESSKSKVIEEDKTIITHMILDNWGIRPLDESEKHLRQYVKTSGVKR